MPLYWWFIIIAIIVALNAEKIDNCINANGKLKKIIVVFFVFMVVTIAIMIKNTL
ncbi:MAG: protein CrcB-like protein [Firmicutes bacterium]|nr:protein CrcB-like protein [Bacillota bacterium]